MSFPVLQVTDIGEEAMLAIISDQTASLRFTTFQIGNGDPPEHPEQLTELVNAVTGKLSIADCVRYDDYVEVKFNFRNAELNSGFYWRELGLFAENYAGDEILFGYANAGDRAEYIADKNSAFGIQDAYTVRIYLSNTSQITGAVSGQTFALQSDLETVSNDLSDHIHDYNNPHQVQVGDLNMEQAHFTFVEAPQITRINVSDVFGIILGKIAKAVHDLIDHINNAVVHITDAERSRWNNKANSIHYHAASDITSGILSKERGGTGSQFGVFLAQSATPPALTSGEIFWINTGDNNALYFNDQVSAQKGWKLISSGGGAPSGGGIVVSNTAPDVSQTTTLWIDTNPARTPGVAHYSNGTTWLPVVAVWGSNS